MNLSIDLTDELIAPDTYFTGTVYVEAEYERGGRHMPSGITECAIVEVEGEVWTDDEECEEREATLADVDGLDLADKAADAMGDYCEEDYRDDFDSYYDR
jgi:hypothetical protein